MSNKAFFKRFTPIFHKPLPNQRHLHQLCLNTNHHHLVDFESGVEFPFAKFEYDFASPLMMLKENIHFHFHFHHLPPLLHNLDASLRTTMACKPLELMPVSKKGRPDAQIRALQDVRNLDGEEGWGMAGAVCRRFGGTAHAPR